MTSTARPCFAIRRYTVLRDLLPSAIRTGHGLSLVEIGVIIVTVGIILLVAQYIDARSGDTTVVVLPIIYFQALCFSRVLIACSHPHCSVEAVGQ